MPGNWRVGQNLSFFVPESVVFVSALISAFVAGYILFATESVVFVRHRLSFFEAESAVFETESAVFVTESVGRISKLVVLADRICRLRDGELHGRFVTESVY